MTKTSHEHDQEPQDALLSSVKDRGGRWLRKTKLRVFAAVICFPLIVVSVFMAGPGWLAIPVIGAAYATLSITISKFTAKLSHETCGDCGGSLAGELPSESGIFCPACGALNQYRLNDAPLLPAPGSLAFVDDEREADQDPASA